MARKFLPILLAMTFIAAAPTTQAFSITADNEERLVAVGETAEINYTVSYTCADFVDAGTTSVDFTVAADLDDAWGFSGDSFSLSGQDCLNAGQAATKSGTVSVTPTSDLLAYNGTSFTLTANDGSTDATFDHSESLMADYNPGHTVTADIEWPYTYTGDGEALMFNVTVDVTANGDTMVMFIGVDGGDGSISGLGHQKFFLSNGQEPTRTLQVEWTPPSTAWTEQNITFENYSHCLADGFPCDPQVEDTFTWTIMNENPGTVSGGDDDKDSPGVGPVMILGLLGAAFVAMRRK